MSGAHGLRGQLRIRVFGGDPAHLLTSEWVFLADSEAGARPRRYTVEGAEPGRRGELRLRLAGVAKREQAQALAGKLVLLEAARLEPLDEDEYYEFQLVGCRVEEGDGRALGVVRGVWATGAADVLVVAREGGGEHLIPLAKSLLREIDVPGRRIVVEPIPGLLEPDDG